MKTILTALVASAFLASPALACSWNKSADMTSSYTASVVHEDEEAMSTFDPAAEPAFEEKVEQIEAEDILEEEAAE